MTDNTYLPTFVIAYSDSSFTNPHEVALPDDPQECTGNFTHMGAKYWGFETARHRATTLNAANQQFQFDDTAYHWIEFGLKHESRVNRIDISTRWFTGNQVQEVAVDFKVNGAWLEVISRTPLQPDQEHHFEVANDPAACPSKECRVRCYHEGGISRISLFGAEVGGLQPKVNLLDSATISHVSNEHYGKPSDAVAGIRGIDYMFGWESARTGFGEYALFHLEEPAAVSEVVVDTYLHRLNPPLACHIFGLDISSSSDVDAAWAKRPRFKLNFNDGSEVIPEDFRAYMADKRYYSEKVAEPSAFSISLINSHATIWRPLVPFGALRADTWHSFSDIEFDGPVSHILYMHYPNGGIHGLKVFGL